MCTGCVEDMRKQELLHQNVQRLEAWASNEASRRRIAEALALEVEAKALSGQARLLRAAFVWETTGSRKDLRKVVEQIMGERRTAGGQFVVIDPAARQVEQPTEKEKA